MLLRSAFSKLLIPKQNFTFLNRGLKSCSGPTAGDLDALKQPNDLPIEMEESPYEPEKVKCILCANEVKLDYKNPRLLSQFLSNFSGRLYEKHVTGLCEYQHQRVKSTISQSRRAGYMPVMIKNPRYLKDPKLFDPMKPIRPNPF